MSDKSNEEDLFIEDDLVDKFMGKDTPQAPAINPTSTPTEAETVSQPVANPTSVDEVSSSDTRDWIENAKVDLPGQLDLDVYETKNSLIVLCRIAGIEEENIDVSISADNILNIRGNLATKIEEKVENHFIQECYWGEFSRSLSLPVDVKKDNINATLENGILKITFVKIKQDSVKKINIRSKK